MNSSALLAPLVTPTLRLENLFAESDVEIFAKMDMLQVSGSTKERTAHSLVEDLLETGRLRLGGTIVESTSGNLGISLARQCVVRGLNFIAVVDETANPVAISIMAAYGATVDLIPTPPDGNRLAARRLRVAELLTRHAGSVTTNQYGSPANPRAHARSTMPEVLEATGPNLDYLFVATSTTGTLLGCQNHIREHGLNTKIVAVDSVGSVLFGGTAGTRRLPGLGAGIVPELANQAAPDHVVQVPELDMVRGCHLLARSEGILAGASTGAIVSAMGQLLPTLSGSRVALIVHDSGVPYLETVYNQAWVSANLGQTDSAGEPGAGQASDGTIEAGTIADVEGPQSR